MCWGSGAHENVAPILLLIMHAARCWLKRAPGTCVWCSTCKWHAHISYTCRIVQIVKWCRGQGLVLCSCTFLSHTPLIFECTGCKVHRAVVFSLSLSTLIQPLDPWLIIRDAFNFFSFWFGVGDGLGESVPSVDWRSSSFSPFFQSILIMTTKMNDRNT